jgi:hypothetical protein
VNPADIRAYAARDWSLVAASKRSHAIAWTKGLSPAAALKIADDLRRHVQMLRPDRPSPAEREADIEMHARVAAGLRSVR